ncbi:MAG: hypothetical protein PHD07_00125 [Bacteroidales bacterium]|nr:hypothetical protein [Bacteroidales bacterium]MDD3200386.1 hypothetical protein [Bacteroidales bacterium]
MNLRVIKKDVEYLLGEFVDDCLLFALLHPEKDTKSVEDLVNEAFSFADTLFARINHPLDGTNKIPANKRAPYYKAVTNDLLKGIDGMYDKLSALAK